MKYAGTSLVAVLSLATSARAQSCESSVFARNGAVINLTEYDASNHVTSVQVYTVANVAKTAGGVQSAPRAIKTDKNGKVTEDKVYHYACDAQGTRWGLGLTDTKTNREATLLYPVGMKPGQDLHTQIVADHSGKTPEGQTARFTVKIQNRRVVGTEKVTVKAGSWACTKITYDFSLRIKVGLVAVPINVQVTEWYSPAVGVVRSESRSGGKPVGHSEITAVKS